MKNLKLLSLYFFFFISGASALLYQVLWNRMLARTIGSNSLANTATVTAFMLGLSIGSIVISKHISRIKKSIRIYGFLEIIIGIYAFFLPFLSGLLIKSNILNCSFLSSGPFFINTINFLYALLILFIPTFCMGATLPLIGDFLEKEFSSFKDHFSRIYGINTLGAAFGSLMTGFFILRYLGIEKTILLGISLNILVAVWAFLIKEDVKVRGSSQLNDDKSASFDLRLIAVLILSSFTLMTLEMVFIRALGLCFGHSIYGFSAVLFVFIISLAIGSILAQNLKPDFTHLFMLISGTIASIFISSLMIKSIPGLLIKVFQAHPGISFNYFISIEILLSLLAIMTPPLFMGGMFPLICIFSEKNNAGKTVGRMYFYTTLGDIAGTLAGGLIFIPYFGIRNSIIISEFVMALCVLILVSRVFENKMTRSLIITALIMALFGINHYVPGFGEDFYDAATFYRFDRFKQSDMKHAEKTAPFSHKLLYEREGREAIVTVREINGVKSLAINGKVDASDGKDMQTQVMLGRLPMIFKPDAKDIFIIGWGSGVTASSVSEFPVHRIDAVEISPSVLEASHYFSNVNKEAYNDKRVKVYIQDARNFVSICRRKYDVIISEPSNLWISGIGDLFTIEFFKKIKSRLDDDGIVCQWLHCYEIRENEFKSAIRTFSRIFKFVYAFRSRTEDLLMIGSNKKIDIDDRLKKFFKDDKSIQTRFSTFGLNSYKDLSDSFICGEEKLSKIVGSGDINTDDNMYIEFHAPFGVFKSQNSILYSVFSK